MDRVAKLLRKVSVKDRKKLLLALKQLQQRNFKGLNRKKLKGYDCIYRIRIGNYRIIYFDDGQELLVKHLKQRNERSYRDV